MNGRPLKRSSAAAGKSFSASAVWWNTNGSRSDRPEPKHPPLPSSRAGLGAPSVQPPAGFPVAHRGALLIRMKSEIQPSCPRCHTLLRATAQGSLVCPRCELAGALGVSAADDLPLGGVLGNYTLESLIARGGMG